MADLYNPVAVRIERKKLDRVVLLEDTVRELFVEKSLFMWARWHVCASPAIMVVDFIAGRVRETLYDLRDNRQPETENEGTK